jgi:hypothetical protein
MDGFFGKKQYAAKTAKRFIRKLAGLLCLECSTWHKFLISLLIVSITDHLRRRILSLKLMSLFFIFFLIPVIK